MNNSVAELLKYINSLEEANNGAENKIRSLTNKISDRINKIAELRKVVDILRNEE